MSKAKKMKVRKTKAPTVFRRKKTNLFGFLLLLALAVAVIASVFAVTNGSLIADIRSEAKTTGKHWSVVLQERRERAIEEEKKGTNNAVVVQPTQVSLPVVDKDKICKDSYFDQEGCARKGCYYNKQDNTCNSRGGTDESEGQGGVTVTIVTVIPTPTNSPLIDQTLDTGDGAGTNVNATLIPGATKKVLPTGKATASTGPNQVPIVMEINSYGKKYVVEVDPGVRVKSEEVDKAMYAVGKAISEAEAEVQRTEQEFKEQSATTNEENKRKAQLAKDNAERVYTAVVAWGQSVVNNIKTDTEQHRQQVVQQADKTAQDLTNTWEEFKNNVNQITAESVERTQRQQQAAWNQAESDTRQTNEENARKAEIIRQTAQAALSKIKETSEKTNEANAQKAAVAKQAAPGNLLKAGAITTAVLFPVIPVTLAAIDVATTVKNTVTNFVNRFVTFKAPAVQITTPKPTPRSAPGTLKRVPTSTYRR